MSISHEIQRLLLGPLVTLLADESVTELLINGPEQIFVERRGCLERLSGGFPGGRWQLKALARNIAESVGRPFDAEHPRFDGRLVDRSRVCMVMPPCAEEIHLSIRPFRRVSATLDDLVRWNNALTDAAAEFLKRAVAEKRNIVVSGGTGSGKSTLLNALARLIPPHERIILIEDTHELNLEHPHVVSLEAQPAGTAASLTIRDLFVTALRMRPDRPLIGEVRQGEALDVAQAMLSGHSGVMTTLHANSPRAALLRFETLCLMADVQIPLSVIRTQLTAIDLIVQVTRDEDGRRRVSEIAEVSNGRSSGPRIQYVFRTLLAASGPVLVDARLAEHGKGPGIGRKMRRRQPYQDDGRDSSGGARSSFKEHDHDDL
jgi:pilus assembly protein CpaF